MISIKQKPAFGPSLALCLLTAFIFVLWGAGGASRADVAGQIVVRTAAWLLLLYWAISRTQRNFRSYRWLWTLLAATALSVLIQLIPLPPSMWGALPGAHLFTEAAQVSRQPQPWRQISISPSVTLNSLFSLVVPLAVLSLAVHLSREQHYRVLGVVLALVILGGLVGLAQFSGAQISSPMVNYVPGATSGTFANRNHFTLFMAIGILCSIAWTFASRESSLWRSLAGLGAVLFAIVIILATGSRSGLVLAVAATILGIVMTKKRLQYQLNQLPKSYKTVVVIFVSASIVSLIVLSIVFGRAASVGRATNLENADDLRFLAFPTVLATTARYFPLGSGYGTFDTAYRISEPASLLSRRYFNHAHNDFIEIILQGGLVGSILLVAAVGWWGWRSWHAWGDPIDDTTMLQRAGSAILLLILLASVTDYPARTPTIMAVVVIAAVWLEGPGGKSRSRRRAKEPNESTVPQQTPERV